jgi:putative PEP-CTERM system histidine kinase
MGSIVLAVLLMTEKLRRKVKVFITKHFFANKYEYRVEWLKLIKQLENSSPDDYYETALNVICAAVQITRGALVKKSALGHYQLLHCEGVTIDDELTEQLTQVDKFCQQTPWVIDIREYEKIANSYPNLVLDSDTFSSKNITIIVPITKSDNLYGFFLLGAPADNKTLLNWEDRDLLAAISTQLSHYISLNEANDQLSQAKQFDAFNRMSAFLIHDLKNVQAQLALISSNAKKHRNNPDFIDDAFETVESATSRLEKVLMQLRNKVTPENTAKKVNLQRLLTAVVAQRNHDKPSVSLIINDTCEISVDSESFSSVINHLIQNAQEATTADGWVKIEVTINNDNLKITISDNGCGMSADFIKKRLFKPFDTTKGNAGMGIGVFEAKQFVEQLGGSIHVTSSEGKGTTFHVLFPLAQLNKQ